MKPTKSILILLSLFLMFSCDEKEEELPNELSLDWILLKKVIDEEFYVESCDGYEEGYCICNNYNNDCGDCRWKIHHWEEIESCDGYDICEYRYPLSNNLNSNVCCSEINLDNPTNVEGDCWVYQNCSFFLHQILSMYEKYKLYWDNELNVCDGSYCGEYGIDDYDIVIPSYIPKREDTFCSNDNYCESNKWNGYFHPNCDTPLDTTITIGSKSVSFEKMGWLDREYNGKGYIIYLRNEEYLQNDGNDIDLSNYKVVDYQRKE